MFSKDDYQGYFEEMLRIEGEMEDSYKKLSMKIDDEKIKKAIDQIKKDESEHQDVIKKMSSLILNEMG